MEVMKGLRNVLKSFSVFLTIILVVSSFSGCSGKQSLNNGTQQGGQNGAKVVTPENLNLTGFPIVKQPITLKGFGNKNTTHADWDKMYCFVQYEKMTGIKIEWDTPGNSAYAEKKNLLLASGNLPDLFYRAALTPADEVNYGTQGVFISMNSLIDNYGPNLKGWLQKDPVLKKTITQSDGKIYTLPEYNESMASKSGQTWINKVWLDNLSLKMPTTTNELYEVLKAFKEKDPNGNGKADEIPISDRNKGKGFLTQLLGAWGLGNKGPSLYNNYIDVGPDGKMRFFAIDPKYKDFLQYVNKIWKDGLIDQEAFTQDMTQFTAKGDEGLVGSFFQNNTPEIIGSKHNRDYVSTPVLKGPNGDQMWVDITAGVNSGRFAITNVNKYPEATMRWIDYHYGEEGSLLFRLGEEGKSYIKLPSGELQLTEEITNNQKGLNLPQAIGQYAPGIAGGGCPQTVFDKYERVRMPEITFAGFDAMKPYVIKESINMTFTIKEQEEITTLLSDIIAFTDEMRVKFVTGAEPFSNWDSYTSKIKQMGLDRLMKIYSFAYERWQKN